MTCPSKDLLQLLVAGTLEPDERTELADHVATCATCHRLVVELITKSRVKRFGNGAIVLGTVLDKRLRLDDIVGIGSMGIVVSATDVERGTRVAVKVMRDALVALPAAVERFLFEARQMTRFRSEHAVRILDIGLLPSGAPYLVMELLVGTDLARALLHGPLSPGRAVDYVLQACVAVAESHALGIVHRDLKPANLFVTRTQLVKVLDCGLAKALADDEPRLSHVNIQLGSPGYMSPEQIESPRSVDARTDIWALGATLYHLVAGRPPFPAPNATAIAIQVASAEPLPIPIDPELRAVIDRCLAKSRERRYPEIAELVAALEPFRHASPQPQLEAPAMTRPAVVPPPVVVARRDGRRTWRRR